MRSCDTHNSVQISPIVKGKEYRKDNGTLYWVGYLRVESRCLLCATWPHIANDVALRQLVHILESERGQPNKEQLCLKTLHFFGNYTHYTCMAVPFWEMKFTWHDRVKSNLLMAAPLLLGLKQNDIYSTMQQCHCRPLCTVRRWQYYMKLTLSLGTYD